MSRFFDMNNPVMRSLSTAADLMILNLLTILCCLPVVSAGAALTALNAASIKIIRGEETSPVKDFFHAFRESFRKGSCLGLLFLFIYILLFIDYQLAAQLFPILRPVIAAISLLVLMLGQYSFALFARYENTIRGTLKNSFLLAVGYFPRTLAMAVFAAILWLLSVQFLRYGAPVLVLFGLSLPCYMTILLLQPVFMNLEK